MVRLIPPAFYKTVYHAWIVGGTPPNILTHHLAIQDVAPALASGSLGLPGTLCLFEFDARPHSQTKHTSRQLALHLHKTSS